MGRPRKYEPVVRKKQMGLYERMRLEVLYNAGIPVRQIAEKLGYHRSTIYKELKRGKCIHRNSDWTETEIYSYDLGQQKHDFLKHNKGKNEKIGKNIELIEFIEIMIADYKYSPEAALAEAVKQGLDVCISLRTVYRYIDSGLFYRLTNEDLPEKKCRKRKKQAVRAKRLSSGKGIEERDASIQTREEFGHWEMDTVKGKQGKTKSCLLVLTERKTRQEIIFKMKDQKSASVVECINMLESEYRDIFKEVFKTITVDNGVEFARYSEIEKSSITGETRTQVFFCHPYSSWERGSNERANKLIRRQIPKSTDIDRISDDEIARIEKWVNDYPRRMFGYQSSADLYNKEIDRIRYVK